MKLDQISRGLFMVFLISGTIFTIFQTQAIQIPTTLQDAYAQSQNYFACPSKNVQHWDKIVFVIISADLAKRLNLPLNSMLDIKILDDPTKVADLKKEVLNFLNVPNEPRSSIEILQVRYAMICVA